MYRSVFATLALLFCLSPNLSAQQPTDSVHRFQAIRLLPLYLFTVDAQQLRLGYETGNELASWQYELGMVLPLYGPDLYEDERQPYGFALQAGRRWAMGRTTYLTGTLEYRLISYKIEGFVGRGCEDGQCDFQQFIERKQLVHSPTTHLMLGKRFRRATGKTYVDLEAGLGYKWAFRTEEEGEPFFLFDLDGRSALTERKFNLRINLNIGFLL